MKSRSHQLHGVHRLRHRLEQTVQRNPWPSPDANVPPQSQHSVNGEGLDRLTTATSSNVYVVRAGTARSDSAVAAIRTPFLFVASHQSVASKYATGDRLESHAATRRLRCALFHSRRTPAAR